MIMNITNKLIEEAPECLNLKHFVDNLIIHFGYFQIGKCLKILVIHLNLRLWVILFFKVYFNLT